MTELAITKNNNSDSYLKLIISVIVYYQTCNDCDVCAPFIL